MKTSTRTIIVLALALGFAAGVQAQPRSITNQLVLHLSFDNTMNDDSGRGNNATYTSAYSLVQPSPTAPTYVPGKLGNGFQFNTYPDGSLIEYATLGYPTDLQFGTDTDFSIAFWFKTYSTNIVGGGDPAIIANRNWDSSSSRGIGVFLQGGLTTVRVHYTITEPSTSKLSVRPATPAGENLYDGGWHHIAVTFQRLTGTMVTWVDGVKENTSAYSPGYNGTNLFDTYMLSDNGVAETFNVGQDGTGTYTQGPGNNPPAEAGSAGVTNAAVDDVGIWRRALSDFEIINMYNFAQLGTNLFNVPDVNNPILLSLSPNNGATGVIPSIPTRAVIQDQSTQVDPSSIRLSIDGIQVTPTVTKVAATNTIAYTSPFLYPPLGVHTNVLIYADNGTPIPTRSTNVSVYTIAAWTNQYLGTPLYVENFDELAAPTNPPAVYPTGWSVSNCTDPAQNAGTWSLSDPTSDAYLNWQIVPIDVIATSFNYDGNIYSMNGPTVANGVAYSTLGSNNIVFAASDQRNGNQVDYLFTKDYDLTGQTNVWVAFNSMFSQEDFELGALEYSIDQGTTWLPILYLLSSNPNCIVTNGEGVLDPAATMGAMILQIPYGNCGYGNSYGVYIGVTSDQWANLGPYIRTGPKGNHVINHKVEQFRLPQADGQSKVRFRFAFVGSDFWDWGFDYFGLYSKPASTPDLKAGITTSGSSIIVNWNGSGATFSGLQKATSLTAADWTDVIGTIGQTSYTNTAASGPVYYRAKKF